MNQELRRLAQLIAADDVGWNQALFVPPFTTLGGWIDFWHRRRLSVSILLRKPGELWSVGDFHALFIACWLYHPVEKGSFMIPLPSPLHRTLVQAAMGKLEARWSSHLSKQGARSAGQGFAFLKGYHELLVQYEETQARNPSLFLKAEGHSAASLAHVVSWVKKSFTGAGATVNPDMNTAGRLHHGGIQARAAENYDKAYEKLLDYHGFEGTQVQVAELLPMVATKLREKGFQYRFALEGEEPYQSVRALSRLRGVTIRKQLLLDLLTQCIIPTVERVPEKKSEYVDKVRKALPALRDVVEGLERDLADPETAAAPRVFAEVRVTFDQLDRTIAAFVTEATAVLASRANRNASV